MSELRWDDLKEGSLVDVRLIKSDESGIWVSTIVLTISEEKLVLGKIANGVKKVLELERRGGGFVGTLGSEFEIKRTQIDELKKSRGLE